ncbi:MAG: enoyl-CoA hydratase/isomerase family protein [Gammaproteobacteria bacterium]|nr:enoyl-CoA hydratase/isomerase family protein [Gammaproteobacteria bacterium]MBQ0841128.1 enoyl-CoA hydratase/isomerase family protein [Gammaproteobacteria bacterium]
MSEQPVLFSEKACGNGKKIAIATLNAEKALNSLSLEMVDMISAQAELWEADDSVVCILLDSAGDRAFAAGGDIRMLYESMVECGENYNAYATDFFSREYRLNHRLHNFPKPIIAWGNGFVMGGGMGLFEGADFRVVTESTRIAMPEVTIGLLPDVGGTWFLNQARGNSGLFLALTGAQINAADALYIGLGDVFIPHAEKAAMLDQLATLNWTANADTDRKQMTVALDALQKQHQALVPAAQLEPHMAWIDEATAGDTLEAVVAAISAYEGDNKWLSRAVATLKRGCPASIFLAYELNQRGRDLPLNECLKLELIGTVNCAKYGVFREGIRAQIIEKDNQPKFQPATLAEFSSEMREQYLTWPWADKANPLADL